MLRYIFLGWKLYICFERIVYVDIFVTDGAEYFD